jgi:hypothetical protein
MHHFTIKDMSFELIMSGQWYDVIFNAIDSHETNLPKFEGIKIKFIKKNASGSTVVGYTKDVKSNDAFVYLLFLRINESGNPFVSYQHPHKIHVSDDLKLFEILQLNVHQDSLVYTTDCPEMLFPYPEFHTLNTDLLIEKGLFSLLVFCDIRYSMGENINKDRRSYYKDQLLQYDKENMFKGIQFVAPGLFDSIEGTDGDILIESITQSNLHWLIFYYKFIKSRWVSYVLAIEYSTMMAVYETNRANEEVKSVEKFMEILKLNEKYYIKHYL